MEHSGLRFQHYKNHKFYNHIAEAKWHGSTVKLNAEFVGKAIHTETKAWFEIYESNGNYEYLYSTDIGTLTIYQSDYNDPEYGNKAVWARPDEMFWGYVEVDEDEFAPRFRLVD